MKKINLFVYNVGNLIFLFIGFITYIISKEKVALGIMIVLFASILINAIMIEDMG